MVACYDLWLSAFILCLALKRQPLSQSLNQVTLSYLSQHTAHPLPRHLCTTLSLTPILPTPLNLLLLPPLLLLLATQSPHHLKFDDDWQKMTMLGLAVAGLTGVGYWWARGRVDRVVLRKVFHVPVLVVLPVGLACCSRVL